MLYSNHQSNIQHSIKWILQGIILNTYHFSSTLILLTYQNPFIEYAIFESCLSCNFLVWVQNFSTIRWIVNFNAIHYSSKVWWRKCISEKNWHWWYLSFETVYILSWLILEIYKQQFNHPSIQSSIILKSCWLTKVNYWCKFAPIFLYKVRIPAFPKFQMCTCKVKLSYAIY